jgi:hypothetical protein
VTVSNVCVNLYDCSLVSLQYSEIEKANHQATVSVADTVSALSFATPRTYPSNLSRTSSVNNVAITQSATGLRQSAGRSDFNQNRRTNSQYPEAPIAEPVIKIASPPKLFLRKMSEKADHMINPHSPIKGVDTLKTVASVINTNT